MKDIENKKIMINPDYKDSILNLEESVKMQLDKKKILNYVRHKKV